MTTRGTWSVELGWDGLIRTADRVDVTVDEAGDLLEARPRYQPRRFTFPIHWPEAPAWIHEGRPAERALARVYFDGVLVGEHPVQSVSTRRGSRTATVVAGDVPVRNSVTLPPTRDATVRRVDQDATQEASQRQAKAWQDYLSSASGAAERKARQEVVTKEQATFDPSVYAWGSQGLVFPINVGQPGRGPDGTIDTCTPAIKCVVWNAEEKELAFAGHYMLGTEIVIWTTTEIGTSAGRYGNWSGGEWKPLRLERDAGGRLVTIVKVHADNYRGTFSAGGTWYPPHFAGTPDPDGAIVIPASWSADRTWYAACVGDTRGLSSHPCDIIPWLVGMTSGVRPDYAAFEAVRTRLRGWDLDTSIDAETSAWDVVERDVVPLLPLVLSPSVRGVGCTYVDLDPHPTTIGRHLVVGRTLHADPDDELRVERGNDRVNQWRLGFQWNAESSRMSAVDIAGPERHQLALRSATRYGFAEDRFDTAWIYRRSVAKVAAFHMLQRSALVRQTRRYLADPAVHGIEGRHPLRLGDTLFLTDSDLGMTRRRAIVSAVRRVGVALALEVSILDEQ